MPYDERPQAPPDEMTDLSPSCDVAIVGAGAAGLAAAIFARRASPSLNVLLLDGAVKPGAKILVSGGGRCNVTNTRVAETDFWGGKRTLVRRVLRGLPVDETVAFFRDLGVPLHEEAGGKLFPDSNRARDVLEALLTGLRAAGVVLSPGTRVHSVARTESGFSLETSRGPLRARQVVLATGGRSLPKSGSDGGGYEIARALGHTLVAPVPALAPLLLDAGTAYSIHHGLSGIAIDSEIAIWIEGAIATRLQGALLWTHFGVSGPVVLNASRHWARARLEGRGVRLTPNMHPHERFEDVEARWIAAAAGRPRASVRAILAADLPDAVAVAALGVLGIPIELTAAELTRDDRRRLVHALVEWPLPVTDTRGYNFAEVTSGGVELTEIDPSTMESRVCPGLFLVGEILDVDGRIGGFNFQWAWSSAFIAGRSLATDRSSA
jgi:predicted Rossmann fold flavoprotein